MAIAKLEEICDGVPSSCLDSRVSDIHISAICSHINEWRELAPHLDLSRVDENDIAERFPNRPKLQRREALYKWREVNGKKATYRKLIHILCSHGRVATAEHLKEILVNWRGKDGSESHTVIKVFNEYLCDCYSTETCHPSYHQWPFSSNHSYVPLDLYDVPLPRDAHKNSTSRQLPIESIFGNKKVKRRVILVEGLAGSGKSTLCWYACKEWGEGRLFQEFELLITISDAAIHSSTKLADVIPHPSEEIRDAVARAIISMRGKRICFLLDGCDEAPQLFTKQGSFLSRFIEGTGRCKLPNVSILLTSRPLNLSSLLNCITRKIVVKGFTSLDQFIEVTIKNESTKRAQLFEAFQMKPELHSLCQLPLHAVILIHLFDFLRKSYLPHVQVYSIH